MINFQLTSEQIQFQYGQYGRNENISWDTRSLSQNMFSTTSWVQSMTNTHSQSVYSLWLALTSHNIKAVYDRTRRWRGGKARSQLLLLRQKQVFSIHVMYMFSNAGFDDSIINALSIKWKTLQNVRWKQHMATDNCSQKITNPTPLQTRCQAEARRSKTPSSSPCSTLPFLPSTFTVIICLY